MFDERAAAFLTEMRTLDVSALDAAGVEAHLEACKRLSRGVSAFKSRLLARSKDLAAAGSGAGPRETLVRGGDTASRSADRDVKRSDTLGDAPTLADALADGDIDDDHVDALGDATRDLPEPIRAQLRSDPSMADAAKSMNPDQFRRHVDRRARRLQADLALNRLEHQRNTTRLRAWTRPDGMVAFAGELDSERGAAFLKRLDDETLALARRLGLRLDDNTRALALLSLIERGHAVDPEGTPITPAPADVTLIDAATLTTGHHDHSISHTSSGAPLPVETIRRHLCHANIWAIVLADDGTVLDAGRSRRTANRAQRRALRAMYPTCAFDNCNRPFDHCQIHHINPWENGGPTNLDDLLPLCTEHHHLVHEGRWRVALDHHRTLTITRPDGVVHAVVPLPTAALARHLANSGAANSSPSTNGSTQRDPAPRSRPVARSRRLDDQPTARERRQVRCRLGLEPGPEPDPDPDLHTHEPRTAGRSGPATPPADPVGATTTGPASRATPTPGATPNPDAGPSATATAKAVPKAATVPPGMATTAPTGVPSSGARPSPDADATHGAAVDDGAPTFADLLEAGLCDGFAQLWQGVDGALSQWRASAEGTDRIRT